MRGIRRTRWLLLPIAAALVWTGAALAASAQSRVRHDARTRSIAALRVDHRRAGDNHAVARVLGRLARPMASGTYIYAEDGTCPDGIDVYSVTGTGVSHVENVSVGCSDGQYFGEHQLAVATTPADCLLLNDENGDVYSFAIDSSTGLIPATPTSTAVTGGTPGDLLVSGSTVYTADTGDHRIDVLTLGSGCSLTVDSVNSTGTEYDTDIALAGAHTIVSDDYTSGDYVAYTLQSNGTLVETAKTPGQLAAPAGTAAQQIGSKTLVFTGEEATNPPSTQGATFDGATFTPLVGSPATSTDPTSSGGYFVSLSSPNHLLLQGDVLSSQVGWFTVTGGGLSYVGDTPLAQTGEQPANFTVAGNDLLVPEILSGDVEACGLSTHGVSHCRVILATTGAGSGNAGSVAVF